MSWIVILGGAGLALLVGLGALAYFADRIFYARGLKKIAAVPRVPVAGAEEGQPVRLTGAVRLAGTA